MTRRVVTVLAVRAPSGDGWRDVDPAALQRAMVSDVVDVAAALEVAEAAVAAPADLRQLADDVAWPVMPVVTVPPDPSVAAVVDAVAAAVAGVDEVAVVAGDVPDLPPLLLGKLHSALTSADVAVVPAEGGGLVACAVRRPVARWFDAVDVRLDDDGALDRLRAAAPPRALSVAPGWHRVRAPVDLARLDVGLEGWEATRVLLGR